MEKEKHLIIFQIIAIIFSIAFGILLHFTYELSVNNSFVASFSSVNTSSWEHLKLAFFPMLIFTIIEFLFASFVLFTYFPPKVNYFKDPITKSYGID